LLNTQKLKIAMISIHASPLGDLGTRDNGGMSVCVRELARELGRRGHRVDIFTRASRPSDKGWLVLADNVRLVYLKVPKAYRAAKDALYPHLPDYFKRLEAFRLRERIDYDLVHSNYWLSGYLGNRAQSCWGVPHITTFHTLGLLKNSIGKGSHEPALRIAVEKQVAQACDHIVVGSRREQHNLRRHYHVATSKIGIAPCGVDLKLFRPFDRTYARRRLGLDTGEKVVLYVGRFDPLKGISRIVEAMGLLQQHPVRFVIAGGDGQANPEVRKLQALARRLSLDGAVRFAGRVDQQELPLYYSAADVLAVPSLYESFGIVALEALACGTPVITTPVGAMDSIISNGRNGCIVRGATPAAFARAIQALIAAGPAPASERESIRATVASYGWACAADSMLEHYRLAIAGYRKEEQSRT
jgi:D-inositol-3-phosphate glycosyltransferase